MEKKIISHQRCLIFHWLGKCFRWLISQILTKHWKSKKWLLEVIFQTNKRSLNKCEHYYKTFIIVNIDILYRHLVLLDFFISRIYEWWVIRWMFIHRFLFISCKIDLHHLKNLLTMLFSGGEVTYSFFLQRFPHWFSLVKFLMRYQSIHI